MVATAIVWAFLSIAHIAVVDLMIASAHYHHRDGWDRDGMPRGMYWRPPDVAVSGGWEARSGVVWKWLFRTPAWAAEGNQNFRILLRIHRGVMLALLAVAITVITLVARG